MTFATQRLLGPLFFALVVLFGSLTASGQQIDGLHGGAAKAVESQVRRADLRYAQASIFYGDLTGRGTNDAISFVYHDSGGSAPQLTTWIWREADGTYTLARTVPLDDVFGLDPRNVIFSPGRIAVTTTVPRGNDPHCCPTGVRTFTLEVGLSGTAENMPAASAQSGGNWSATTKTNPAMVNVTGTATDGKAIFSGGCNSLLGAGFTGSLYGYTGEALQRIDDQSETVTFEVAGGNGVETFAGMMHYFAPEEAWVITGALPVAFLEAFARGHTLTIRNGRGEEAVAFGLSGSSKAVQIMRSVCGMQGRPARLPSLR